MCLAECIEIMKYDFKKSNVKINTIIISIFFISDKCISIKEIFLHESIAYIFGNIWIVADGHSHQLQFKS